MNGKKLQEQAREQAQELPGSGLEHPFGPGWEVFKVRDKVFMLLTDVTGEPDRHRQGGAGGRQSAAGAARGHHPGLPHEQAALDHAAPRREPAKAARRRPGHRVVPARCGGPAPREASCGPRDLWQARPVTLSGEQVQQTARDAAAALERGQQRPAVHAAPGGVEGRDKVFLIVTEDDPDRQIITVKADPHHADALRRDHDSITAGHYLDKQHWISVGPGRGVTKRLIETWYTGPTTSPPTTGETPARERADRAAPTARPPAPTSTTRRLDDSTRPQTTPDPRRDFLA